MVASTKANRLQTPKKSAPANSLPKKSVVKPNHSILNFFKKSEKQEGSLFVGAASAPATLAQQDDIYSADDVDENRYNEAESPNKRRRLSKDQSLQELGEPSASVKSRAPSDEAATSESATGGKRRTNIPFVIDPDSDDDDENETTARKAVKSEVDFRPKKDDESPAPEFIVPPPLPVKDEFPTPEKEVAVSHELLNGAPPLKQEDSVLEQFQNLDGFEDMEDVDPDAFEGEEMRVMKYMREQARLEAEEAGGLLSEDYVDDPIDSSSVASCPVCDGRLAGASADEAARHVNSCLDGNPIPLPEAKPVVKVEPMPPIEVESGVISKRFAKAAVPRPGQANPLDAPAPGATAKSAFSKLMSGNAEDSAWATAAATEHASRGKPAYERTCPFYKIMPGFNICVDAFRYGAVQDCEAYFLSHFHSDHYIGLTANWRHGPIYCSKVTGSLVKQQLRTAAKYVVEIEFDKPYDVPGTGVSVTMIPANHCPGSSLFLFSKPDGQGPNSRIKRILHCGDFRACPAHVRHPLLKPDVVDSISGKTKQQKIDICYLDTTYLNPRYSFPPQGQVIRATAELCTSISPDPDSKDDVWDLSAKSLGTPTVSKYFKTVEGEEGGGSKSGASKKPKQRLLVICGTYSIGKERICVAIAKALKSKIFASAGKIKICKQLDDPELAALLTTNPVEAQVHMQMLMEIRAETLQEYLNGYKPHFSRIVGFRPSGWNFRPVAGKSLGANTSPSTVPTQQILHGKGWRTQFAYRDFVAQRGSTKEAMCFGVPYSEHSSFRELAMFVMSLRIDKVIPTVNVGSEPSRKRMKAWVDRWMAERRKGGLVLPMVEGEDEVDDKELPLWDEKSGKGGAAWW